MTTRVTIEIDHQCCVGSSVCLTLAPAVFTLNTDSQAAVLNPAGAPVADVLEAAEGCPTMAIKVVDADSGAVLFPPP